MLIKSITRRFAAWIVCVAMLFAALAPSVSHAMSAPSGDVWTAICSVAGIKLVKTGFLPADADAGNESSQIEHCAFCATHPTHVGLLPGMASCMPLVLGRDTYPALYFQSPHPLAAWTRAQSRAPPP